MDAAWKWCACAAEGRTIWLNIHDIYSFIQLSIVFLWSEWDSWWRLLARGKATSVEYVGTKYSLQIKNYLQSKDLLKNIRTDTSVDVLQKDIS